MGRIAEFWEGRREQAAQAVYAPNLILRAGIALSLPVLAATGKGDIALGLGLLYQFPRFCATVARTHNLAYAFVTAVEAVGPLVAATQLHSPEIGALAYSTEMAVDALVAHTATDGGQRRLRRVVK
ncbi:MAG TPA: hypothetical protein VFQ63_00355 [Patescibacteria group bacterium]|nr:hypothetical protein [Patescibacteria group bacterium]